MDVPRVEVTSFLHKSAGAITNFDVTDEVASGKLLLETIADDKQKARATLLSLPSIFSSTQASFNFITFSQNHPTNHYQTCLVTDLELVTTPLRLVTTSFTAMLAA